MTDYEFRTSLKAERPSSEWSLPLQALWHAAKGDWHRAHEAAQADDGPNGAWVHAYLHRWEGDHGNAAYWYRRAGRQPATGSLDAEHAAILAELLGESPTLRSAPGPESR